MTDVRLIDANALLKEFEKRQEQQVNEYCDCFLNDAQELSTEWWCVEDAVTAAPTIDAVEVVHGRWEDATEIIAGIRFPQTRCTACGKVYWGYRTECYYCPNCGAKMDGGEDFNEPD